jgi:hypothetical protein
MRHIPLHAKDGSVRAYAIVDDTDFEWLSRRRWSLTSWGYASTGTRSRRLGTETHVKMHREILGLKLGDPQCVDHINGNKLDNRRHNLRTGSHAQNHQNLSLSSRNTSGYRGVSRHKASGKWQARAQLDGREFYLGHFDDVDAAAKAAAKFRRDHMPFSPEAFDAEASRGDPHPPATAGLSVGEEVA